MAAHCPACRSTGGNGEPCHNPACACHGGRQACGCVEDQATGLPVLTCAKHDRRTARVKVAAALAQAGAFLDEAGARSVTDGELLHNLRQAGAALVKASKALINGGDDE